MWWITLTLAVGCAYTAFSLLGIPPRYDVAASLVIAVFFLYATRADGEHDQAAERSWRLLLRAAGALALAVSGLVFAAVIDDTAGHVLAMLALAYLFVWLPVAVLIRDG